MRSALGVFRPCLVGAVALASLGCATGSASASASSHDHHVAHSVASEVAAPESRALPDHDSTTTIPRSGSGFAVGTPERPLVTGPLRGPIWSAPASSSHQATAASVSVASASTATAALAAAGADGDGDGDAATRLVLTKAQATNKLSKRCQRLVKAKRPSKLKKADRKKRTACLQRRRELIAASKKPKSPTTPGVTAPAAPTPGPKPTTPPVSGSTPKPTTPGSPAPTSPTPPGTIWQSCTPSGSSIRLTSFDAFEMYTLSRGCAPAGPVTFTFENIDVSGSNDHNAYIAPVDADDDIDGELVKIGEEIPAGSTRSVTLTMAPGRYMIICTVPGHGKMNTPFQVY